MKQASLYSVKQKTKQKKTKKSDLLSKTLNLSKKQTCQLCIFCLY